MPLSELEPAIPASEWPQTHAFDHMATGIAHLQPLWDCNMKDVFNVAP